VKAGWLASLPLELLSFVLLPGLVLVAQVLVSVLPSAIEWGVIEAIVSLTGNKWRFAELRALVTKEKVSA
jgi:hypothetical protein